MRERRLWESAIAGAMQPDETLRTAAEDMRGRRVPGPHPAPARDRRDRLVKGVVPQIDDMVRQRINWADYQRYLNDPEGPAFLQGLCRHEIGGRAIPARCWTPPPRCRSTAPGRPQKCSMDGRERASPGPGRHDYLG